MENALASLKRNESAAGIADFPHLREIVGFPEYNEAEKRYAGD